MVYGFATFCSQDLQLGALAAPDHAGNSIRLLKKRIDLSQSMQGFNVTSTGGRGRHIVAQGGFDLKYELQKAIKELEMDTWGLDYDDFKQSSASNRPNRDA